MTYLIGTVISHTIHLAIKNTLTFKIADKKSGTVIIIYFYPIIIKVSPS